MARIRKTTSYPVPKPPIKKGPRIVNRGSGVTIKQHHTAKPGASGAQTPRPR